VDSFVLLTEQMKNALPVGDKPCRVVEGIVARMPQSMEAEDVPQKEKYIVYTGKMDRAFGIRELVDAMELLPGDEYRLVLCGRGDSYDYAVAAGRKDPRIMALGQVSPEEAARWQKKSAVLVNPRTNVGEYTKYSFPSKNIEYLLMGKSVVAYMLDGMPRCYSDFLYEIDPAQEPAGAIAQALKRAVEDDQRKKNEKYMAFLEYARDRLTACNIANMMMELNG
jgi:glycosyltransferase involved in cell wall biosynthesis